MCSKALIQQGLLPLPEWYLIDVGREVVPGRWHLIDLIIDGKRIKPSGRQRQEPGHMRTLPPGSQVFRPTR